MAADMPPADIPTVTADADLAVTSSRDDTAITAQVHITDEATRVELDGCS